MTIEELYRDKRISVRSYNICRYNYFIHVIDLIRYYKEHESFGDLKHCGRRSNEELIQICKEFAGGINSEGLVDLKKTSLKDIVSGLNRSKREVINDFIVVNTNSLSVRSKNAILFYLNHNLKIKNFAEKILLNPRFAIEDINNVGKKSFVEIENYILEIKHFLSDVSLLERDKDLNSLKNKFFLQKSYSISNIPQEILESESIFLITDFLLNNQAFFDKTQTLIIIKGLKLYQNQEELTLQEISKQVNLTSERVRQIRVDCLKRFSKRLLFVQNLNDDLFQKYNIDINSNHIHIDSTLVELINKTNKTNLTREFITYILSAYLNKDFTLIGDVEDVLLPKFSNSRNRYNWKNFYLVKSELTSEIDFNSFVYDIENRVNERIEEIYSFNFKSYLSKFLKNKKFEILNLVSPIAENIINDEFDLYLDLDENLGFKRNTKKQAFEYTYEALESLGKPSSLSEIYKKIIEIHPEYITDEGRVRSSMNRANGFVPIGRKSVFGLKKWEKELVNFRGGTIRSITKEFLEKYNEPKHISAITDYVLKFRPKSNQKSILQNLRLDETGIYIFFNGSKIGLSSKNYSKKFFKSSEVNRNSWKESYESLKQFVINEERLPYSSGCPESERKLYRWFNIQRRRFENEKLSNERSMKIKKLIQIKDRYKLIHSLERQLKKEISAQDSDSIKSTRNLISKLRSVK